MPSVRRQVDRHGLRVCVYSTARDTLEDLIQREDRAVRGFHVAVKALRVQEIEAALVIDHDKYESYKQKYLTSRIDSKPNYQVILDEIINS